MTSTDLVIEVVDDAGAEVPQNAPLTKPVALNAALMAAAQRIDELRSGPKDPRDIFDHDGALAACAVFTGLAGHPPVAHVAELEARRAALGIEVQDAIVGAAEKLNAEVDPETVLKPVVKEVSSRVTYPTQVVTAWVHAGFPTYEVARGLWDVIARTEDDPAVRAMPAGDALPFRAPQAFALRFPGPDYPVLRDPTVGRYQIRGCLVYQYVGAADRDAASAMRSAMYDETKRAHEDDEDGFTHYGEVVNRLTPVGMDALPATSPALCVVLAGWRLDTNRAVGSCLENGFFVWRYMDDYTVSEGITRCAEAAARDSTFPEENRGAYRQIIAAAIGAGLWLTHSEDKGERIRSKPVKLKGMGESITPDVRVLGRGVKRVCAREEIE